MCNLCADNPSDPLRRYAAAGLSNFKSVDFGDIGDVRKLLAPCQRNLPDSEVAYIRDLVLGFAADAFEWWLQERNAGRSRDVSHNDGEAATPPSAP